MDYGKFLYEKSKSSKEQKKKQKVIQVKEIKFRPGTDDGDYQEKLRSLIRFLEDGDKAKITLRFRGREMAHQQIGMEVLTRVRDDLSELAVVESFPTKIEGRQMIMVLAPKKKHNCSHGEAGKSFPVFSLTAALKSFTNSLRSSTWSSVSLLFDVLAPYRGEVCL